VLFTPAPFPSGAWSLWRLQISMNSWADWEHLHTNITIASPQTSVPRTDVWAGQVIKARARIENGEDVAPWVESGPIDLD
jgi:hypothetical protein